MDNGINFGNQTYLLEQLRLYEADPNSVEPEIKAFFDGMNFAQKARAAGAASSSTSSDAESDNSSSINELIKSYRRYGHLLAFSNPMLTPPATVPKLELSRFGFTEKDLSNSYPTHGVLPTPTATLKEIIDRLKKLYCSKIGYECMNLNNQELEDWIHERVVKIDEGDYNHERILEELFAAKELENFLQKKFLGAKRFSIEGCETLLPMLFEMIDHGAELGYKETALCMAHRGRINVLCNFLGKDKASLFHEFQSKLYPKEAFEYSGDVKYHQGLVSEITTPSGTVMKTTLLANPSHLESIDPVMCGFAKAKLVTSGEDDILSIMIHGDASVSGQGVVYETIQLHGLNGYGINGTIHLIINNQVGFTATSEEGRSTRYPSDIAKAFGIPVLHVNSEDVISCMRAIRLAVDIKNRFDTPVFIDLNCHRYWGHNEADEPYFTNPLLYRKIREKEHLYIRYKDFLLGNNIITQSEVDRVEKEYREELDQSYSEAQKFLENKVEGEFTFEREDEGFTFEKVDTKVALSVLRTLGGKVCEIPQDFKIHPKLDKLFKVRKEACASEPNVASLDWGTCEVLAFASMLDEKFPVRLSGQDSKRGTFSHRHACLVDQSEEKTYVPLNNLGDDQARFDVYSSSLSEYAVMGFEYGYSLEKVSGLTIWEGQFGDFANGAQIIIDQFLSSSETKWLQKSNLTLLLPHAQEGMGPEHSSARMERYLQLSAGRNMRVCYPTTPAQYFHLLRRQVLAEEKKPLVVFTPKGLLRYAPSYSSLNDLAEGEYHEILDDPRKPAAARRVILCTGKVYYDLLKKREELDIQDVAIVRIEQLYPLDTEGLKKVIDSYGDAELVFVQEEAANQGAWQYIHESFGYIKDMKYIGRRPSGSTATGFAGFFAAEQSALMEKALRG